MAGCIPGNMPNGIGIGQAIGLAGALTFCSVSVCCSVTGSVIRPNRIFRITIIELIVSREHINNAEVLYVSVPNRGGHPHCRHAHRDICVQ